jgi:integrase
MEKSPLNSRKGSTPKKKQRIRISLPGNCSMSQPSVHPSNWKTVAATTASNWYIQYRFFDPLHAPKGKQYILKGMNEYRTTSERRDATERLLSDYTALLKQGFNPITEKWNIAESSGEIEAYTPLTHALQIAAKKVPVDENTKPDIKWMMNYVPLAIEALEWQNMPIGDVRKKHVKRILDKCADIKSRKDPKTGRVINVTWSDYKYNQFRTYLMIVFAEIVECDALDANPCRELRKKKTVKRKRLTLTKKQRIQVDTHLQQTDPDFWRFLHIFFHSGARETEIMKIKRKDVDLENQTFTSLVKKDRTYCEKDRTIKDIVLPLWKEVTKNAGPDDYLFSYGFKPGPKPYSADNINKKWKAQIKDEFAISADFYSLKHSNTTETVNLAGDLAAATQNAHKGTGMVVKIYDVDRSHRIHESLKEINNPFAQ